MAQRVRVLPARWWQSPIYRWHSRLQHFTVYLPPKIVRPTH